MSDTLKDMPELSPFDRAAQNVLMTAVDLYTSHEIYRQVMLLFRAEAAMEEAHKRATGFMGDRVWASVRGPVSEPRILEEELAASADMARHGAEACEIVGALSELANALAADRGIEA